MLTHLFFLASHTQSANATIQPNSMAQVLALSILTRWGHTGFFAHSKRISEFYKQRRDICEAAARRHLTGLAEWSTPESGMFIWCVPFIPPHPLLSTWLNYMASRFKLLLKEDQEDTEGEGDSENVIRTHAFQRGVLAIPGVVFLPSNGKKTPYVRAAFSVLEPDAMDEALRRLREAILDARKAAKAEG